MLERLQKILSARGIASRRKAEEYIQQGLVKVNGQVATLGQKADPDVDTIEVDGRVIEERKEMLYYVMNKPVGILTENLSSERESHGAKTAKGRGKNTVLIRDDAQASSGKIQGQKVSHGLSKTVYDLLPPNLRGKIYPVGRLDKDSSGLLLFTNDGVLAYRLTHPSFDHEKEYEVVLDRPASPDARRKLEEGFELDGSRTKPMTVTKVAPNRLRMTLTEGRNRQIRRMCQNVGYGVKALRRVRIQTLTDDRLAAGALRALREEEKTVLLQSVGL